MSMLKHIGQLDVDCLVQLSKIFIENKQEHVTSIQTPAKTMKVCGFFWSWPPRNKSAFAGLAKRREKECPVSKTTIKTTKTGSSKTKNQTFFVTISRNDVSKLRKSIYTGGAYHWQGWNLMIKPNCQGRTDTLNKCHFCKKMGSKKKRGVPCKYCFYSHSAPLSAWKCLSKSNSKFCILLPVKFWSTPIEL